MAVFPLGREWQSFSLRVAVFPLSEGRETPCGLWQTPWPLVLVADPTAPTERCQAPVFDLRHTPTAVFHLRYIFRLRHTPSFTCLSPVFHLQHTPSFPCGHRGREN